MNPVEQSLAKIEGRYRVLLILWAVFLTTIGMYALLSFLIRPDVDGQAPALLIALSLIAVITLALSFILKNYFLAQGAAAGRPETIQIGYIVALALSESVALFGLVLHFVTGERYAYLFFAVAAAAMFFHVPRRAALLAAQGPARAGGLT